MYMYVRACICIWQLGALLYCKYTEVGQFANCLFIIKYSIYIHIHNICSIMYTYVCVCTQCKYVPLIVDSFSLLLSSLSSSLRLAMPYKFYIYIYNKQIVINASHFIRMYVYTPSIKYHRRGKFRWAKLSQFWSYGILQKYFHGSLARSAYVISIIIKEVLV